MPYKFSRSVDQVMTSLGIGSLVAILLLISCFYLVQKFSNQTPQPSEEQLKETILTE